MRVFFDFEFTHLGRNAQPISLGCVSDSTSRTLYVEFSDFDQSLCSPWVTQHVLPKLRFERDGYQKQDFINGFLYRGQRSDLAYTVRMWLYGLVVESLAPGRKQHRIEFWGDVVTYDWLLMVDLLGGPEKLPPFVYYIPFDIATLLNACGVDPDVDRTEFTGFPQANRHNALEDAATIRLCYDKIIEQYVITKVAT